MNLVVVVVGVALIQHDPVVAGTSRVTYDAPPAFTPFSVSPGRPASSGEPLRASAPPGVGQPVRPAGRTGCSVTLRPSQIAIPDVCVDGPLVPTSRTVLGALVIPPRVTEVGLWDRGAPLDGRGGTTLVAGHVSYAGQGRGTLFSLSLVRPGSRVYTVDAAGQVRVWRVVRLESVVKSQLPEDVFAGSRGVRRLVVVTCGGPILDDPHYGHTYRDNVIATAVPL